MYSQAKTDKEKQSMMWDIVFVLVTAGVAWHGLTYRDAEQQPEPVHLLFGCIALLFCLRVLLLDVLQWG
jgi:hypothetical protein